jgi:hypothetical protein
MGFNDTTLSYDVSLAWSDSSIEQNYSTMVRDRTENALNGLGGPNCTPNGTPNFPVDATPFGWHSLAYGQQYFLGTCSTQERAPLWH